MCIAWKLFSSTFVKTNRCNEIYPIRCNTINEFCCVNSPRDQKWERTSRTQIDFFLHSIMSFACDWQLVLVEVDSIFEETHHGWNIATICNRNESVSQHWHTHLEVLAIFSDGFLCSVYLWMWFILWLAWFRVITEWFDRANWIIWLNRMEINEFILFSCTLQVFTLQGTTENSLFFLMCQMKNGAPYNTQHTKWNTVNTGCDRIICAFRSIIFWESFFLPKNRE